MLSSRFSLSSLWFALVPPASPSSSARLLLVPLLHLRHDLLPGALRTNDVPLVLRIWTDVGYKTRPSIKYIHKFFSILDSLSSKSDDFWTPSPQRRRTYWTTPYVKSREGSHLILTKEVPTFSVIQIKVSISGQPLS